jgi:NAD(P)-dependent dehydrogenase (short-subunit alcohol dehydrogenase family)
MPVVLITGANRGIGLELTRQYLEAGWQVIACCRHPKDADELLSLRSEHLDIRALDVTDLAGIEALAAQLSGVPIDVLINNAGIIGPLPVTEHIDRQHFGSIDYDLWERVIRTNTFGPVKMAEALLPNLLAGGEKKIVTLSSTVGSITERDTPAFAYATSKTAVNKAMALLAAQLIDQGVIVALVCPGYVKTRMDFGGADVEAANSAAGLRKLIAGFSMADSGSFTRFNGETIAW